VLPKKPAKTYKTNGELYQYSEKLGVQYDIIATNLAKVAAWTETIHELERKQSAKKASGTFWLGN
jgi:hypothetical protein